MGIEGLPVEVTQPTLIEYLINYGHGQHSPNGGLGSTEFNLNHNIV